jgi:hypothetical protein
MTGTSPAATTLTPESSEQPRETRDGLPLAERFDGLAALIADGPRRLNEVADRAMGKVSSPELASLAAKYVNFQPLDMRSSDLDPVRFASDVRSLAASVLAQAEGNPRK